MTRTNRMSDDSPVPEGYERVPIEDWDGIEDALRRIAGGTVESSNGEVSLVSGSATFTVTREGGVDAGMPLHAFERESVEALYVDADRGRIRVYGPDGLAYEFRTP
jgi:hypothetical protein